MAKTGQSLDMSFNPGVTLSGNPEEPFQIISTMRVESKLLASELNNEMSIPNKNCPIYMFPYHRDRMLQAAHEFSWPKAIGALSGAEGACRLLDTILAHLSKQNWEPTSCSQPVRVRSLSSA